MSNKSESQLSSEEIVEYLTQNGFAENQVRQAMKETNSSDFDVIINHMVESKRNTNKAGIKKQERKEFDPNWVKLSESMAQETRKKLMEERRYREQLIQQIEADKREKLEKERLEEGEETQGQDIIATEDIADCRIKLWVSDGRAVVLGFSKDDTVEMLFKKIEERLGLATFRVFQKNSSTPIERSSTPLKDVPELFPRSVLFLEE
jgi:hypothetical protein